MCILTRIVSGAAGIEGHPSVLGELATVFSLFGFCIVAVKSSTRRSQPSPQRERAPADLKGTGASNELRVELPRPRG